MIELWEDFVLRLKSLPEKEMKLEVDKLVILWEIDFDLVRDLCMLSNTAFTLTRKEHREACKKQLEEAFGYSGMFGVSEEAREAIGKKLISGVLDE